MHERRVELQVGVEDLVLERVDLLQRLALLLVADLRALVQLLKDFAAVDLAYSGRLRLGLAKILAQALLRLNEVLEQARLFVEHSRIARVVDESVRWSSQARIGLVERVRVVVLAQLRQRLEQELLSVSSLAHALRELLEHGLVVAQPPFVGRARHRAQVLGLYFSGAFELDFVFDQGLDLFERQVGYVGLVELERELERVVGGVTFNQVGVFLQNDTLVLFARFQAKEFVFLIRIKLEFLDLALFQWGIIKRSPNLLECLLIINFYKINA